MYVPFFYVLLCVFNILCSLQLLTVVQIMGDVIKSVFNQLAVLNVNVEMVMT